MRTEITFWFYNESTGFEYVEVTKTIDGDKIEDILSRIKNKPTKNKILSLRTFSMDTFETVREIILPTKR